MVATTIMTQGRPNPTCWRFFDRLQAARVKVGMTREALSKAAGVNPGATSRFELRKGYPRLPTLEAFARALHVSPGWLAFGLDTPWEPSAQMRCAGLSVRVREVRATLGISVREVERRSRLIKGADEARTILSEGAVRGVERGRIPPLDTLEALAVALKISPSWLAFGLGPKTLPRRSTKPSLASDEPAITAP